MHVLRINQCITQSDVKIVETDAVKEHIDATKVVRTWIDFLSVVFQIGVILTHCFGKFQ